MSNSSGSIRVVQIGLGPIGCRSVAYLVERGGFEIIAAVDVNPELAGADVGELAGVGRLGVAVGADLSAALALRADVAVVTTGSSVARVAEQIATCVRAATPVVSTCEELAHPFLAAPQVAEQIDSLARANGVAVLGTGVNPGFLMDALPTFLTSVCKRVTRVRVERFQDASIRRLPFQQKIGAGQTPEEFGRNYRAGKIRHVGFTESIQMIASALRWRLDRVTDEAAPVIAERAVSSRFLEVAAGQCAGLRQLGQGFVGDEAVITLELQAYLGHPDPRDTVIIDGEPPIRSNIEGGVDGDIATCAMVVSAIPAVLAAAPGLRTMADVPLTHWSRR